jgi:hypothetical protein
MFYIVFSVFYGVFSDIHLLQMWCSIILYLGYYKKYPYDFLLIFFYYVFFYFFLCFALGFINFYLCYVFIVMYIIILANFMNLNIIILFF